MPKSTAEILAHAEELAREFETFEPLETEEIDALDGLTRAVIEASNAQRHVNFWVTRARAQHKSWESIGAVLGVSGEAARQKYRDITAG